MMIKDFISDNLNGMSFTFTVLVLLNALVAEVYQMEVSISLIWVLAILVLVSYVVSHAISYFDFSSEILYHTVNLGTQYAVFVLMITLLNLVPFTLSTLITNGVVYSCLYLTNVRKNKIELQKLAAQINQEIAKK